MTNGQQQLPANTWNTLRGDLDPDGSENRLPVRGVFGMSSHGSGRRLALRGVGGPRGLCRSQCERQQEKKGAGGPGPGGHHRQAVMTARVDLPAPNARNSNVVGQAVDTRLSSVVVVTPAQRAHPIPEQPGQGAEPGHRGLLTDRLFTSRTRSDNFLRCSSVNPIAIAVIGHPHDWWG
ncbi:hypothetical protein CRV15_29025 (plasmid) [Streptomyces clavuligerus]|uniref:Uncharacterized protein n=1 Tax=Streptomyces clavuligerus TaxID=1901 RepID=B5GUG6_STRCL|nr:hypothetical protein SSCG_03216 [Streptomyces clavuligerus]EFG03678.1 Hypothetical protein SCLAV_p0187 [Streptomyces clavuligerus]QCS09679.1 hypothetical protein CRV15_29025 [Streptomyces clavuligerus]QPJ98276.1 hypothetical protein GE265_35335 [Streptomyces clavuligerus]